MICGLTPSAKALVIILKSEALLIDGHQVVFEESFENNNEVRFYLQGSLNRLGNKRSASYIASVLRQILNFLHV